MSAEMFSATHDTTQYTVGSRKWYTVPLSILVHAVALASAIVVPVVAASVFLPTPQQQLVHMMTEVVKPPPVTRVVATPIVTAPSPEINAGAAPLVAPEGFVEEPVAPLVNISRGQPIPLPRTSAAARLPAPPQPPVQSEPVRPGGQILPPRKVHDVAPEYPAVARAARASGIVIIEAVIDKEGRVRDARVLRSANLLDEAALAAVRQWIYTPTRLNGEPVEVIMTVTVRFQLN